MPLFPLPFLTGFFLILVMLRLALTAGRKVPPLVLITAGFYALQSILLGIHWGFHRLPPPVLASASNVLPLLTWLTLNEMSGRGGLRLRKLVLAAILLSIAAVQACFRAGLDPAVDLIEIGIYVLCGAHLFWLGRSCRLEWSEMRPLDLALPTQRAFFLAGGVLILSAGVDILVMLELRSGGRLAPAVVGYANLAWLVVLLVLFLRIGRAAPGPVAMPSAPAPSAPVPGAAVADPEAHAIMARFDAAMGADRLYLEESLSLAQIARHIRAPARQVSAAVNALRGMNVPQYVNSFRIRAACRMLEETDTPVTEIVFAVGFTTKSNFNREFQRITGVTPSVWRSRAKSGQVAEPAT